MTFQLGYISFRELYTSYITRVVTLSAVSTSIFGESESTASPPRNNQAPWKKSSIYEGLKENSGVVTTLKKFGQPISNRFLFFVLF